MGERGQDDNVEARLIVAWRESLGDSGGIHRRNAGTHLGCYQSDTNNFPSRGLVCPDAVPLFEGVMVVVIVAPG